MKLSSWSIAAVVCAGEGRLAVVRGDRRTGWHVRPSFSVRCGHAGAREVVLRSVAGVGGGPSAGRERGYAFECVCELVAPWPRGRAVEGAAAAGTGEPTGDVKEAVAQPFWFREREFAFEHEQPQPGEQVLGEQRQLEPGLVGFEGVERQPAEAELLRFLDPVLDARVQAMAGLEPCDVLVGLVGEEALVAMPVMVGE